MLHWKNAKLVDNWPFYKTVTPWYKCVGKMRAKTHQITQQIIIDISKKWFVCGLHQRVKIHLNSNKFGFSVSSLMRYWVKDETPVILENVGRRDSAAGLPTSPHMQTREHSQMHRCHLQITVQEIKLLPLKNINHWIWWISFLTSEDQLPFDKHFSNRESMKQKVTE